MYLHIGGNQMIDVRQIIAMFKVHPRKKGKSNPLSQYYKKLILLDDSDNVKCFIVTENCIYGTPISLETITQRYKHLFQKKSWQI